MKILVTGGANGIGNATVVKLLDRGHKVTVIDRDEDALEKIDQSVSKKCIDVRDRHELKQFFSRNEFDVVVSNAGFYEMGSVEDMSFEAMDEIIDTNLKGTLNVLKYSLPGLRKNSGRIVIISSVMGEISAPHSGVYSASKHALEGLADSMRMELRKHGVKLTVVQPGPVDTGFNQRAIKALSKYFGDSFYEDDYRKIMKDVEFEGIEPEKAARTVLAAVEEEKPERRYPTTPKHWLILKLWNIMPWYFREWIMEKKFTEKRS